jgi:hypothetical protein
MKYLELKIVSCAENCPYYNIDYNYCGKSNREIFELANNQNIIPDWCELETIK